MPDLKEIIKHYPEITGIHEACLAVPEIDQKHFDDLAANIAQDGLRHEIILSNDGLLIDGRNRLIACWLGKIEPRFAVTELDPWDVAFAENIARRHLDDFRRGLFVLARSDHERRLAKQRMEAGRNQYSSPPEKLPEATGDVRDRLGEKAGVSGKTMDKIAVIARHIDLRDEVLAGEKSIDKAYREARDREKSRPERPVEVPKSENMATIVTAAGKKSKIAQPAKVVFNQTNDSVDWARWTWNPVTGCEHGCRFCYAREIANSDRMADYYPNKFEPTFHEYRLEAPRNTKRPESKDERDGRVFVCSMADLFGKWVPDEWIRKVFDACLDANDWQYMFLTKWPARYSKMPLIPRAWYGASIIQQADVSRVTSAMRRIEGEVTRWVSLEPMLGPIEFDGLEWCDLMVIGSQTSTNQPDGFVPAFSPKFEWVADVVRQCRSEHVPVYLKANLSNNPGMEMPKERPRASV